MLPLYVCSVYQSSMSRDLDAARLKDRLTAEGIPWKEETSAWHDCERILSCAEGPQGWEIGLDAVAQLTIFVPNAFLERGQIILTELGVS